MREMSVAVRALMTRVRLPGGDGTSRPLAFDLAVADDGAITGEAVVRQSEWGMKPYSALFGALKVADEVIVRIDGRLPQSR